MNLIFRSPDSEREFEEYFNFRWEQLRKPIGLEQGSEQDNLEDSTFHIAAYEENKLVGVGRLQFENNSTTRIRYMAVDPKYRNQGIGSQILKKLEKIANNHNADTCWLYARETAISFYKKNGYEIKGQTKSELSQVNHKRMEKQLISNS